MKSKILPILFLLGLMMIPVTGQAQLKVGVSGGATCNFLDASTLYYSNRYYAERTGYALGAVAQYGVTDWFALGAEAQFLQKNYGVRRAGYYAPIYEDVNNSFVNVPVYAQFSFGGKRLRGFVNVGGYVGGWLNSHRKGSTTTTNDKILESLIFDSIGEQYVMYDFDEKVAFDARRDNRFDAGLMAGAGIRYTFFRFMELYAECRYYHGLTDLQKNYMIGQVPRYNSTLNLNLGLVFLFGGK